MIKKTEMAEFTLTDIWIYPIKSLGGIRLDKAVVKKKGLQYDRRWMLINGDGVAMTQRVYPAMALFKLGIQPDQLNISFKKPGGTVTTATFNMRSTTSGIPITAQIWDDRVKVIEVEAGISEWFTRHLGTTCRLVAFPEVNPRPVDVRYSVGHDHVSLA